MGSWRLILTGNIVWLASYPKSGNTWLRIILDALLLGSYQGGKTDINSLKISEHAGSRSLVEAVSACPSSELSAEEVDQLRPAAFQLLSEKKNGLTFVKVHDAYRVLDRSVALFPANVSRQVIYILRNPLDVAVSFSAHLGLSIDDTISLMSANFDMGVKAPGLAVGPQVRQRLGSWSFHVESWTTQGVIPVHVIRYEDLVADVGAEVMLVARLLRLQSTKDEIAQATAAAKFERLQAAEIQAGFREKPASLNGLFFRSGSVGGWQEALSSQQADRLIGSHLDIMARFGYLSDL